MTCLALIATASARCSTPGLADDRHGYADEDKGLRLGRELGHRNWHRTCAPPEAPKRLPNIGKSPQNRA